MSNLTYSILTCALHEHTYINAFISHYSNLGFQAFYILCDKNQPSYSDIIIPRDNIKINLIQMNYPDNKNHLFDSIQIMYYNNVVKNIDSDWILLCDIDEFLYLKEITIQNYMNILLQKLPNVSQVSFPWMIIDQLSKDNLNMFDNMKDNKWFSNPHVKSMFKKKALSVVNNQYKIYPHDSMVNGPTYFQKGISPPRKLNGSYQNTFDIQYYRNNSFFIHFHVRSFKNNVVKLLTNHYAKKSDDNQKNKFLNIASNKLFDYLPLRKFSLIPSHQSNKQIPHFDLVHLNTNILPNYIDYNDKLFDSLIEKYKLDKEYFNKILENPQIVIHPSSTLYIAPENNS